MKWLVKALLPGRAATRTPIPPKPYAERVNANVILREQAHQERLANIDPERPHWRDPKFESREKVPFFDVFGYNRNWSWTLFKVFAVISFGHLFLQEGRIMNEYGGDLMRSVVVSVSAKPDYARDDTATEAELKAAGFAYVGTRQLDNVGVKVDSAKLRDDSVSARR